ncbi:hypothetical protein EJ110_NYTH22798 [Nymphaea thermarum]|nr:hypothetical protein EJ110_NYTH22798 [Nymphaea thermarum]
MKNEGGAETFLFAGANPAGHHIGGNRHDYRHGPLLPLEVLVEGMAPTFFPFPAVASQEEGSACRFDLHGRRGFALLDLRLLVLTMESN